MRSLLKFILNLIKQKLFAHIICLFREIFTFLIHNLKRIVTLTFLLKN